MKLSHSLRTCGIAVLLLALNGCADQPRQATVSQKTAASQTSSYRPPYTQGYGQNVARDRLDMQPVPPLGSYKATPVTPAPMTTQVPAAANARIKVAILLPLTGRSANLGQAMLNAAQQAVFDAAGNNFVLQPHDTAADGGAEAAARAAVGDGAQLIIGPLFAADIPAVQSIAASAGIEMLTLSTDTSMAERGTYVMGLAPGPQVERVVGYAAAHGAHRFAALVPSSAYGNLVGQAFQESVMHHGGALVDYETFDGTPQGAAAPIKTLAMQHDMIDALFVPVSGPDLKNIADQLTAAGFDGAKTHMLGTGLWDVPGLGRQSAILNGGWYAAPDPATRQAFVSAYTSTYGQEPPRLVTLAYDATALAAVLAKRGGHYDDAALTNLNGFAGLDGIFRLLPSGQVERALAVNEVTPDSARVVDGAPVSFVGKK